MTFRLSFSNTGPVVVTSVVPTDVVPAEVRLVAFESSRQITPTGMLPYTWLLGGLPPKAWGVITISGVVAPELPIGYVSTNTTMALSEGDSANDWVRMSTTYVCLPSMLKNQ